MREREGRSRAEREREREVCKLKAGLGRQGVIGTREIEIVCKGFKKIVMMGKIVRFEKMMWTIFMRSN